jgi:hypothetical protein
MEGKPQEKKEKKEKIINSYMAKKSQAQLLDKMQAAGLEAVDISAIQRLPISVESQMEIVNHILYEKAMEEEREQRLACETCESKE